MKLFNILKIKHLFRCILTLQINYFLQYFVRILTSILTSVSRHPARYLYLTVVSFVIICFCLSVYDVTGAASDRNSVVLNDIHIDIMDYIVPASCTDTEFRQMWAEFEWENKVAVVTNVTDLHEYLDHLIRSTNMKCLTPEKVEWHF